MRPAPGLRRLPHARSPASTTPAPPRTAAAASAASPGWQAAKAAISDRKSRRQRLATGALVEERRLTKRRRSRATLEARSVALVGRQPAPGQPRRAGWSTEVDALAGARAGPPGQPVVRRGRAASLRARPQRPRRRAGPGPARRRRRPARRPAHRGGEGRCARRGGLRQRARRTASATSSGGSRPMPGWPWWAPGCMGFWNVRRGAARHGLHRARRPPGRPRRRWSPTPARSSPRCCAPGCASASTWPCRPDRSWSRPPPTTSTTSSSAARPGCWPWCSRPSAAATGSAGRCAGLARPACEVVLLPVGHSPLGSAMVAAHSGAVAGGSAVMGGTRRRRRRPPGRRPRRARRHPGRALLDRGDPDRARASRPSTTRAPSAAWSPTSPTASTCASRRSARPPSRPWPTASTRAWWPSNPLDVWGGGADTRGLFADCLAAMAADPAVGVTALAVDLVPEYDGDTSYPDALLEVAAADHGAGGRADRAARRRRRGRRRPPARGRRPRAGRVPQRAARPAPPPRRRRPARSRRRWSRRARTLARHETR